MELTLQMNIYNQIILIVIVKIPSTCSKIKEIPTITLQRLPRLDRPHGCQGQPGQQYLAH